MSDTSQVVFPYIVQQQQRNPYAYQKVVEVQRDLLTRWLDLTLIKSQLNLYNDNSQDLYLEQLETATRIYVENYLGIALTRRTFTCYYNGNGLYYAPAYLDLPLVQDSAVSVDSVMYYNSQTPSVLVTIDPSNYQYDESSNRVLLYTIPPDISAKFANALLVTYELAPSPMADYLDIKQAGLMLLTHFYNNRSSTAPSTQSMVNIPFSFEALLSSYKPVVM